MKERHQVPSMQFLFKILLLIVGEGGDLEPPNTIAPDNLVSGMKILYRKTKGIKFNRNLIIRGKLANRNKILIIFG
jgi:hypothetical protein